MKTKKKIKIFEPAHYRKSSLDIGLLNKKCGVNYIYAAKGRYSIWHILNSLEIKGNVLISSYMCPSVLKILKKYGFGIYYFDINLEDLNPSYESIEAILLKQDIAAAIIPSMYGNPAQLQEIEALCRKYKVKMIDDAAQSFGATLNNRYVGTFGDGGFFSFSPGKSTAGHMGSFFWTSNKNYEVKRTSHKLFHYMKFWNYYNNRYNIYNNRFLPITSIIGRLTDIIEKLIDIKNDDICAFEKEHLGGILKSIDNDDFSFRKQYYNRFFHTFSNNTLFRIIKCERGISNPSKIVLIFNTVRDTDAFCQYMQKKDIFTYRGYSKPETTDNIPNCMKIINKIVELPIESSLLHMMYLMDSISEYIQLLQVEENI